MFHLHFWNFFKKISSTSSDGIDTLEIHNLPQEVVVEKFEVSVPKKFTLSEVFHLELSNGETMEVLFLEKNVITALYCNSSFHSVIGPEFCLVFDIMYAKTGMKPLQNHSTVSWRSMKWMVDRVMRFLSIVPRLISLFHQ